jgi:glycosyltransferase involved in cell wall biosynthesis
MYKISVIIPVYNIDKYLKRCLENALNQTLKQIEIICIDDGSTDDSSKILTEYLQNHKNFIVKTFTQNQGVSAARNAGLSLAQGEYLAFVDGDDEVDLNFYEKLYQKAKETDADIVKGQVMEIEYGGKRNIVKQLQEIADNKFLFLTHWGSAIYKRALIAENNITFPHGYSLGEDLLFLNKAVFAAKNLQLVCDVYYNYYRREDSGDSKILTEEKINSALTMYETVIDNVNLNMSSKHFFYNLIFHHFIMLSFYLSLRSDDRKMKEICARVAINIFEKCQNKDDLQIHFSKTTPHLFMLLKNQDNQAITDILINCKSRAQLIVSGLRARINK